MRRRSVVGPKSQSYSHHTSPPCGGEVWWVQSPRVTPTTLLLHAAEKCGGFKVPELLPPHFSSMRRRSVVGPKSQSYSHHTSPPSGGEVWWVQSPRVTPFYFQHYLASSQGPVAPSRTFSLPLHFISHLAMRRQVEFYSFMQDAKKVQWTLCTCRHSHVTAGRRKQLIGVELSDKNA
ncbi:hypothetical protein AVEN_238620-1 [Araneus ventricosus]|uniref:Uncharacterized protein n=1 Tax=Araneus ventricosus TaxID=182803 RepID=A0A4Y2R748_ARAVE|nr:hypothetical protein AVEN_238620-1 [Araneus ventricosus]